MNDVEYSIEQSVAVIRLNRPRYRNAQSRRMLDELDAAFEQAAADDDVRAVVLTGNGTSFSSGHDLGTTEEQADQERPPLPTELLARDRWSWERWSLPLLRWRSLPKPTLAAISGHCLYAGWSLASAMDLRVCGEGAVILPHLSEFFSLPWIIGTPRAKEILFRNRALPAGEALDYGLVHFVVADAELEDFTLSIAAEIAEQDPTLLRSIKSALNGHEDQAGYQAALMLAHTIHVMSDFTGSDLPTPSGDGKPLSPVARALAKLKEGQPRATDHS